MRMMYPPVNGYYPGEGGYRIKLWNTALENNWNIHFVGSLSNGPDSLGDKNHEGHIGYRIDEIAALLDDVLATYNPLSYSIAHWD